jgi:hypothetical protein
MRERCSPFVARPSCRAGGDDLEICDYKVEKPAVRFAGRADTVFDTTGEAADYAPITKKAASKEAPEAAHAVSIATVPSGDQAKAGFGPAAPWLVCKILDFKNWKLKVCFAPVRGEEAGP